MFQNPEFLYVNDRPASRQEITLTRSTAAICALPGTCSGTAREVFLRAVKDCAAFAGKLSD
jgi:hypothetical protein